MVEQQKGKGSEEWWYVRILCGAEVHWWTKTPRGCPHAKKAGWIIVETANINAEDGIQKHQRVKLKLRLSVSYVYEAEYMIHHIKGFDIVLQKRWMCDVNRRYQIDHDRNEMWIADTL